MLRNSRVIPVLTVERTEDAAPLARALVAGGLKYLEVTLRTPVALEAIRIMADEVPDAVVGAGTVRNTEDLDKVYRAGARFAVSPMWTEELAIAVLESPFPWLPGVMTPTEAVRAYDYGSDVLKLFPAKIAGGLGFLKAIGGPMPDLRFCPTGGIDANTFRDYLALPNVLCVGGSWVATRALIAEGNWAEITRLAAEASSDSLENDDERD